MKKTAKPLNSDEQMNALMEILLWRLDELFDKLEISLTKVGKLYLGVCPIHGGDNVSALNLYPEGDSLPGYWQCQTHHCERIFKETLIGFVRGVLSHKYLGWSTPADKDKVYAFPKILRWLEKFIGCAIKDIKIDNVEVEKRKFTKAVESFTPVAKSTVQGVKREAVRKHLVIPADYYIKRGYSPSVLDSYDIGLCKNPSSKEMFGRIVVPVYDDDTGLMIGCLGRSPYDECKKCLSYHSSIDECPITEEQKFHLRKWKNSYNFHKGQYLYNYWKAKRHIKRTGVIILVEGPGDVWRLEEAGIFNSVALFGNNLSDDQQIIIEMSGAMNVIGLLDKDKAGQAGINKIKEELQFSYKLYFPELKFHDIGDTPIEEIRKEFLPLAKQLERKI